jgi:hypothetical protein
VLNDWAYIRNHIEITITPPLRCGEGDTRSQFFTSSLMENGFYGTPFIVSDVARNASLPNGSRPGTIKITSSAIRLRAVSTSPVSLAFIHVALGD